MTNTGLSIGNEHIVVEEHIINFHVLCRVLSGHI